MPAPVRKLTLCYGPILADHLDGKSSLDIGTRRESGWLIRIGRSPEECELIATSLRYAEEYSQEMVLWQFPRCTRASKSLVHPMDVSASCYPLGRSSVLPWSLHGA